MQVPLGRDFTFSTTLTKPGFPYAPTLIIQRSTWRRGSSYGWRDLRRITVNTADKYDTKTRRVTFDVPAIRPTEVGCAGIDDGLEVYSGRYFIRAGDGSGVRFTDHEAGEATWSCGGSGGDDGDDGGSGGSGGSGGDSPFGPITGGDPLPTSPNAPDDPCLPTPYTPPTVTVPTPCAGGSGGDGPGGWGNPGAGS